MPHRFCTLFDSTYLTRALALHGSLRHHRPDAILTAYCFDDEACTILEELALPGLELVGLPELEGYDPALAAVRHSRTPGEFCWTATPTLPLHLLDAHADADRATYLDADLWFFADPQLVFDDLGDASVAITPHRYAPEFAHHAVAGIYCVQWVTFRRDDAGLEAARWWHDRCIEWCHARLEDGKFGDQKYLDDWPERFPGVHVIEHKGAGLAPWNLSRYSLTERDSQVWVDDDPLVFHHFHGLKRLDGGVRLAPPGYRVDRTARRLVYAPYLQALTAAEELVRSVRPGFRKGIAPHPTARERLQAARAQASAAVIRRAPWTLRLYERARERS